MCNEPKISDITSGCETKQILSEPGFYRLWDGQKAQIIAVQHNYAFGLVDDKPSIWRIDGIHMGQAGSSGVLNSRVSYRIVGKWEEPIEKWVAICYAPEAGKFLRLYDEPENIDSLKPVMEWRKIRYTKGQGIEDITP